MEPMSEQKHVYIALSGGVDSAVAAVRLLDEGFKVTGIFMGTWQDPQAMVSGKNSTEPAAMAEEAAKSIGIHFVSLDVREQFFQTVVEPFIRQYLIGKTPNPCLFCNPQVKWGLLQNYAFDQGADYFATGHYARVIHSDNSPTLLLRGLDCSKDQSYVLALLTQSQLSRTLLPLGAIKKTDVRAQAKLLNLPVADRQESQDLCFLGAVDYRDFLQRYAPQSATPGQIVNLEGDVLGEHQGLAFYTIGQRRGIRIAASEPYFVIGKEPQHNRLIVGFAHQAGKSSLKAVEPNWIMGEPPAKGDRYEIMIRYRTVPVEAVLTDASMTEFRLEFNQPIRGVTPGQVAVLFQGETCLGGGTIHNAG